MDFAGVQSPPPSEHCCRMGWNDWISQARHSQPPRGESWLWRVAVLGTGPPQRYWMSLVREQHGWRDDGSVVWSICCTSRGPSSILSTYMVAHGHLLTPVWWVYGALFWHLSVLHAYSALTNMQAKIPPPIHRGQDCSRFICNPRIGQQFSPGKVLPHNTGSLY